MRRRSGPGHGTRTGARGRRIGSHTISLGSRLGRADPALRRNRSRREGTSPGANRAALSVIRVHAQLDLSVVQQRLKTFGGGLNVWHALIHAVARALLRHPDLVSDSIGAIGFVHTGTSGTTLARVIGAASLRLHQIRRQIDKSRRLVPAGDIRSDMLDGLGFCVMAESRAPIEGIDRPPPARLRCVLSCGPVVERPVAQDGALRVAPVIHASLAAFRGKTNEARLAEFLIDLEEELDQAPHWAAPPALDPQMREVLRQYAMQAGQLQPFSTLTPAEAREQFDRTFSEPWNADAPPLASVKDNTIPGPRGPLAVRLYDPGLATPAPCLVFLHGGGWVVGGLDSHDGLCRRLALSGHCLVASVDYGLAPENKFPGPLDDAVAAVRWVARYGAEWGIDTGRIAVGGDSAGANLALATSLVLRDDLSPRLRCLMVIYGAFSADFETASIQAYGDGSFLLSRADLGWFWNHYVGGTGQADSPLAQPLRADLKGLPPTIVATAEFDPLLDDSRRLAEELQSAAVPHVLMVWPGVAHGCLHMTRAVDGIAGLFERLGRQLREHLGKDAAG